MGYPGVGQGVRVLVELPVGHAPALIDDGRPLAVTQRGRRARPAQQAVALDGQEELSHAVRRLQPDHAGAHADRGEVGLVDGALGQLQATADDAPWSEVHARVLLPVRRTSDRRPPAGPAHPIAWRGPTLDLIMTGGVVRAGWSAS